jgi:hypothetical protein
VDLRYKIIALVVVLGALWGFHEYDKAQAVAQINSEWVEKNKQQQAKFNLAQSVLEEYHRADKGIKDEKIKDLDVKLANALVRLQHRPTRPTVLTVTETRESCTGRELYREDGEFLTREAASSDKVVVERDYYYSEYEKARLMLEKLNVREE